MNPPPPERRQVILSAALQCFNEHGVEATSISTICACAGASVGSVYHHFGSKEGMARALLVEGLRSNVQHLEQNLSRLHGARSGVRTVITSLIDWIVTHPDWARFIYTNLGASSASHEPELRAVNSHYTRVIADYFAPHLKAGALRKLPRECWAPLMLGPTHDYARRWLNGQVKTPIAEYAKVFADAAWATVQRPR